MSTVTISVAIDNDPRYSFDASASSLDAVRFAFNPSSLDNVTLIKALSAGLISQCELLKTTEGQPARWASIAITEVESGQMFAVKSATYTAPDKSPGTKIY